MRTFATRAAAENALFLEALRRTGNSSLAARETGLDRSTMRGRKRRSAVFAVQWEAAVAAAHAALRLGGGARPPEGPTEGPAPLRTSGGEIVVGRTRGGRLQIRRSAPGRMTAEGENFFCRALAATANVRLAAAAAGFTHSAFYQKKGKRRGFDREWKISLEIGYDRLYWALDESFTAGLSPIPERDYGDDPLPPMTFDQAIQQVCFHRNTAELQGRLRDRRRSTREPPIEAVRDEVLARLGALRRAKNYEETGSWRFAHEQRPAPLPPLHLVTGWSRADPAKIKHDPKLALFGGWRIGDWRKRQRNRP
jgi:hypothetical protein